MEVKTIKTEQEVYEADKREVEIRAEREEADRVAYLEFNEATKEAFAEYKAVWYPAKERWEAFASPFLEKMRIRVSANIKAEAEALVTVRSNWRKCPHCGTTVSRYQSFCSNDKCEKQLLARKPQGINDGDARG